MTNRLTVVLSQGQSNNPAKRKLEETVVAEMLMKPGIDVLVIPHLYDLRPDASAIVALQGLAGDFVLLSWLYPRAAHWILDRQNIRGRLGETALKSAWDERKKKWERQTQPHRPPAGIPRVLDDRPLPDRTIYHMDLRTDEKASVFIDELQRLAEERRTNVVGLNTSDGAKDRDEVPADLAVDLPVPAKPVTHEKAGTRRWYPVIDFSRCTNCMECIDFCLFGVYGIDQQETILVEQPDNCRKGCPACSRVCPENAIIFPQHKTPAIAGDPSIGSEMKIDLSQLFGSSGDLDTAASERDEHLRLAGRTPVVSESADEAHGAAATGRQKDELDELIDELNELDL